MPFTGDWIVLATGSVGDQGVGLAGFFSITTILSAGTFVEPAVGTPLGIRFFDGSTPVTSRFYNTGVNNDGTALWNGTGEPSREITLNLSKSATVFEDGDAAVFRTTIPVPETGPVALCIMAGGLLHRRGRPRGKL